MSSKALAERLGRLLDSTGFFQTVDSNFKSGQITVIGRMMGLEAQWLQFVTKFKTMEEAAIGSSATWASFVAKAYFKKDMKDGRRLVFAWYVIVNSEELPLALDAISKLVNGETPQFQSAPLPLVAPASPAPTAPPPAATKKSSANSLAVPDPPMRPLAKNEEEVISIPLPGVDPLYDRNAPKPGSQRGVRGIR